jgi:uncharacterized protein with PhoU and TrkA domain
MEMAGNTIIVTTPEELANIIQSAIREGLEYLSTVRLETRNAIQGKKILYAEDVEAEFGIGIRVLARWRGEGIGPAYTIVGRRVLYERAVVESFFAEGRVQTTGKAARW